MFQSRVQAFQAGGWHFLPQHNVPDRVDQLASGGFAAAQPCIGLKRQPRKRRLFLQLIHHPADAAFHSSDRCIKLLAHRLQDLLADRQLLAGAACDAARAG